MAEENTNARLEAFCDGVFAIALTLLIIEIKLPSPHDIVTVDGFWLALRHIAPSIFAFVLSFIVILITWVNHHAFMKLVNKSSVSFIYANGFLLLTVVFVPFPTALMGEYILTDIAAPAVALYNAVLAIQGISWDLMCAAVLANRLTKSDKATAHMHSSRKKGRMAIALYGVLAVASFWFPHVTAAVTAATWIFWLIFGITLRRD